MPRREEKGDLPKPVVGGETLIEMVPGRHASTIEAGSLKQPRNNENDGMYEPENL
jgi:hypothetical protein